MSTPAITIDTTTAVNAIRRSMTMPGLSDAATVSNRPKHHQKQQQRNQSYYAKCLTGGVLSSSIRWPLNGIDVVKIRIQVQPTKYSMSQLLLEEGYAGLFRGLGATALAYGVQTGTKYSAYEIFKDMLLQSPSLHNGSGELSAYSKGLIYVTAAGAAEALADVLMCPFEMLKVKLQASRPGGNFPSTTWAGLAVMWRHRHEMRFPFGALMPLWARQVPGTIANFYTFENTVDAIYRHVLTDTDRNAYGKPTQLCVTLAAGYVAGAVSAIVSHPADTMVTLLSLPANQGKTMAQIASEVGLVHLATKGLRQRILMMGTIIGCQWWIYDSFKTAVGLGTSGGQ